MKILIRILKNAKPRPVLVLLYFILIILHTIFRIINFTALIPILRLLFDTEGFEIPSEQPDFSFSERYFQEAFYYQLGDILTISGKEQALYFICAILVLSVLLSNVFQYLATLIQAKVRIDAVSNMRKLVFERVTRMELNYFTETRRGDIMSRINADAFQVEMTVVNTLKILLKEPFLIIGFFYALFSISPELTFYTLLLIPISGIVISFVAKRLKKRAFKVQESVSRMSSIIDEAITGMRIIKAFSARNYTLRKFDAEINEYSKQSFKMAVKNHLSSPISEFLGVLFLSLLLIIGGVQVLSNHSDLDAAEFIIFLILFSQILNPAKSISNAVTTIQRGLASGARLFEIVDRKIPISEKPNAIVLNEFKGQIEFSDVHFSYEEKPNLTGIDFTLDKGKIIALVGPSGAGKTTIAELIPRFYDVERGAVMVDGYDVKDLELNSVRRLMGIVTQDSILFNDTIFNNIAFGKEDATIEEVKKASKIANALEFIDELPEGLNTMIGESGSKLSGGQRQRLSIARAVLKNPPILILDEATSALDSSSEKLVQEALFNLMKNRTTLVIAHRLSTVQHADQILVLEEGKVVQKGTHADLIKTRGLYSKLLEMQSLH